MSVAGPTHKIHEVQTVTESEANELLAQRIFKSGPGHMDWLPLWHLAGVEVVPSVVAGHVEVRYVMFRWDSVPPGTEIRREYGTEPVGESSGRWPSPRS